MLSYTCICLHGFGENRLVYEPFAEEMRKIMPTCTIDLIGHGENRKREYVISEVLKDIDEAIQKVETQEIILVGTSFGGIASYIFASQNQQKYTTSRDKIKALIINDVPCCIPAASFLNITHNLRELLQESYTDIGQLDKKCRKNGFREDREPLPEALWENFLKVMLRDGEMNYDPLFISSLLDPDEGIDSLASGVKFINLPDPEGTRVLDLRYYWQAIDKPILLFRGERTTFFPTYVRGFMDANPNLVTIDIPAGGHFLDLSSEYIMREITFWLSKEFAPKQKTA